MSLDGTISQQNKFRASLRRKRSECNKIYVNRFSVQLHFFSLDLNMCSWVSSQKDAVSLQNMCFMWTQLKALSPNCSSFSNDTYKKKERDCFKENKFHFVPLRMAEFNLQAYQKLSKYHIIRDSNWVGGCLSQLAIRC